jgi:hypothetical protein
VNAAQNGVVARPIDPPVRLADEHRLALVDGNLWWTNLNLERNDVRLTVFAGQLSAGAQLKPGATIMPPNHKLLRPQLGPLT